VKLHLNLTVILQAVLIAVLLAHVLGAYNFVIELRQFQATVIVELREIKQGFEKLDSRMLTVEERAR